MGMKGGVALLALCLGCGASKEDRVEVTATPGRALRFPAEPSR